MLIQIKNRICILNDERCASKPIILSDDSGPSMSKHVEDMEIVLHDCVAKPIDIIVEEKFDQFFTSTQNKPRRERKCPGRYL